MLQRLKSSCKLLSVGLGFFSSCFAYQYQQTVGQKVEKTFNTNLTLIQTWLKSKSKEAEYFLIQYCERLSTSPFFHQVEMTSFLIYLANSKSLFLHELGVKLLAVVQFPEDVDLVQYIQKCDHTALIGLARLDNTNSQWFRQMNSGILDNRIEWQNDDDDKYLLLIKNHLDSVITNVQQHQSVENNNNNSKGDCSMWLHQKISYLPFGDPVPSMMSDFCTERDTLGSAFGFTLKKAKGNPVSKNIFTYLEIFRRYSDDKTVVCNIDVSSQILLIIKEIMMLFPDQIKVQIACGNIIGNLAAYECNRKLIVEQDMLSVIKTWKSGENTALQIIAERILYNLDGVHNHSCLLSDGLYILHPTEHINSSPPDVDIVFVHGIHGSPFHTWRQSDNSDIAKKSQCWPKDWLPQDYPNSRIICVQYESSLSDWFLTCPTEKEKYSLDVQSENIKKKLQHIGVGERPIVWVCHSMGGILVKKLLLSSGHFIKGKSEEILRSTQGILFYSVPHLGSPIATQSEKAKYILFPSIEVNELSGKGKKLKELHNDFAVLKNEFKISCVDFGETRPLSIPYIKYKMMVVPTASCDVGYGPFILLDDVSHAETCKPTSKNDQRYTEVLKMVDSALKQDNKNQDI